jgi:hypothetical protein
MIFGIRLDLGMNIPAQSVLLHFEQEPNFQELASRVLASVVSFGQSTAVWSLESVNSSKEQARSYLSRN